MIGESSCSTWYLKCATGYRTSAKCCHDAAGWLESAGLGFSLYSRQPEGLLRNMELSQSLPLAATSCQSVVKPLSDTGIGFTLQTNRITNNKNSICNE
ncbi:MAG TPA: hypothetical protein DCX72_08735 [Bacteroides uniformis]|nr:hypothetical protein [Bacteroides uniformis]